MQKVCKTDHSNELYGIKNYMNMAQSWGPTNLNSKMVHSVTWSCAPDLEKYRVWTLPYNVESSLLNPKALPVLSYFKGFTVRKKKLCLKPDNNL